MKEHYSSVEDFKSEYSYGRLFSWESMDGNEKFMGLEFQYKDHYYRICREPNGVFHVMEMIEKKTSYPCCDYFEDIGWYGSIDELLDNCVINAEKFQTVIISPELVILSKD